MVARDLVRVMVATKPLRGAQVTALKIMVLLTVDETPDHWNPVGCRRRACALNTDFLNTAVGLDDRAMKPSMQALKMRLSAMKQALVSAYSNNSA